MEKETNIVEQPSFDYDLWLSERIKENTIKKEHLDKLENDSNLDRKERKEDE